MRYIALLRGINVGGHNKVPMKELAAFFEEAGYGNVRTYINSGNALFDSDCGDAAALSHKLTQTLTTRFGFSLETAVISAKALSEAVASAPDWWGDGGCEKHNAFFIIPPETAEVLAAEVGQSEYERVYMRNGVIFWSAPIKTFHRTKWSKAISTKAYRCITVRNENTTRKLVELGKE